MTPASISKIISKSTYNKKKHEFSVSFKDKSVAELVQLIIGESAQRSKLSRTLTFTVNDETSIGELLTLLDVTTSIK